MFFNIDEMLNPQRDIARGIKVEDLANMDFFSILVFFKERLINFYFSQGEFLIKQNKSDNGFIIISICSTLIDTLSTYHYPNITNVGDRFISFLKNDFKNGFERMIIRDGYYKIYERKNISFIQAIRRKVSTENIKNKTFADVFYKAFRNPVIHSSSILSYGGYIFNQKLLFKGKFWNDSKKQNMFELSINPVILFEKLKDYLDEYIDKLKDINNTTYDDLRKRFKKKFRFDFGFCEFPSFSI